MISTRLFEPADLQALYAIEEACFRPPVRFSRKLVRALAMSELCRTWVGLADGEACGFAIVALADDEDNDAAYLWTIEVLGEYRRLGLARALLDRVEASAHAAGKLRVALHVEENNLAGIALYERCGYVRAAIAKDFYGRNRNGFRYEKALQG